MKRIFFLVLICVPAWLAAQTLMMDAQVGIGGSKLSSRPTSPYLQYERFPAFNIGTGLELLYKNNQISPYLGLWWEFGGEKENPVKTITVPLMIKATFGEKLRFYAQGGLAGVYIYERSRRYKTSDFSSIYGIGMEIPTKLGDYFYAEYIHLAGIGSIYDQEMNVPGVGFKRIENYHIRQYLNFGFKFYLGGKPVYYKYHLRTE